MVKAPNWNVLFPNAKFLFTLTISFSGRTFKSMWPIYLSKVNGYEPVIIFFPDKTSGSIFSVLKTQWDWLIFRKKLPYLVTSPCHLPSPTPKRVICPCLPGVSIAFFCGVLQLLLIIRLNWSPLCSLDHCYNLSFLLFN